MSQLKVNSIIPVAGLSGSASGGIIQVVSTVLTSAASFNVGNAATDNITGLSASITPSSNSNKILIMYHINYDITNVSAKGGFRIKRGSTVIGNADSAGNRYLVNSGYGSNNNEDQALMMCSNNFLDSPATTSATTYQMCMHGGGTTQDIFINRARSDGDESDDPRATSSLIFNGGVSLMKYDHNAIRRAYSNCKSIIDSIGVFDESGNSITLDQTKIDAARATLDAEAAAVKYKTDRTTDGSTTYSSVGDQLDLLWHAIDADADLKSKFSAFYNSIKAVKDANPKP